MLYSFLFSIFFPFFNNSWDRNNSSSQAMVWGKRALFRVAVKNARTREPVSTFRSDRSPPSPCALDRASHLRHLADIQFLAKPNFNRSSKKFQIFKGTGNWKNLKKNLTINWNSINDPQTLYIKLPAPCLQKTKLDSNQELNVPSRRTQKILLNLPVEKLHLAFRCPGSSCTKNCRRFSSALLKINFTANGRTR